MVTPMLRAFAQRLLDYETVEGTPPENAVFRVCEKQRLSLSTLVGVAGFRSLLARALALAKEEVPWLNALSVSADGVLVGLEAIDPQLDKNKIAQGEVVFIANLISLLVAFVGEGITLALVRDVWPTVSDFTMKETEGIKDEQRT